MTKNRITEWTPEQETLLLELYTRHAREPNCWKIIAEEICVTPEAARCHWRLHQNRITNRLQESPYPRYDKPLVMQADDGCVIFPDVELPYHHADFINRVLDLAQAWHITKAAMVGDLLHFDSLSVLGPHWREANKRGGLDDEQEYKFLNFVKGLGKRKQAEGMQLLDEIGVYEPDDNLSDELIVARKAIHAFKECFTNVDIALGNHEGRFIRALDTNAVPDEITKLIQAKEWRIGPYYFSFVISNGVEFRLEHPRSVAKSAAETLAAKYCTNVLMAHSHRLSCLWDISGRYYAIQIGHCVDEMRLPYASQRSNLQTHLLAAAIIREGFPYILHQGTDWKRMATMG